VNTQKDDEARRLAEAHFHIESGMHKIVRLIASDDSVEDASSEPIKLLEVNADTVEVGIAPVYFSSDAAHGVHSPSVIVEISVAEFERLQRGELVLPGGWKMAKEFERPSKHAA
jgi:hypothetical protein